jgi:hypothetical protein
MAQPRLTCAHGGFLSFSHRDERGLDVHCGRAQGVDDLEHEPRRDVSRSEVDDPHRGLANAQFIPVACVYYAASGS